MIFLTWVSRKRRCSLSASASNSRNSVAEAQRCRGRSANAATIACSREPGSRSSRCRCSGIASMKRLSVTASSVGHMPGGSPISISYSTQARLYTSVRASRSRTPAACSGLM